MVLNNSHFACHLLIESVCNAGLRTCGGNSWRGSRREILARNFLRTVDPGFNLCGQLEYSSLHQCDQKMAATLAVRKDCPPKRRKGGTVSSKNHRFESFNERVSKLSIDPIRKARRQDDDLDATTSYFRAGFIHWRDLNLSESFTDFVHEVEPLCDSLPLIVHHQRKIFDILAKYIEKGNNLSLEPLLSLLSHLSHDLGASFEPYYERSLRLVVATSRSHHDVEVLEWSFNCLAWIFKYGSPRESLVRVWVTRPMPKIIE